MHCGTVSLSETNLRVRYCNANNASRAVEEIYRVAYFKATTGNRKTRCLATFMKKRPSDRETLATDFSVIC